jgi:ribosomal protein S18 acetylase RimI-like enzyme
MQNITEAIAEQIADLLNTQNQLADTFMAQDILDNRDCYRVRLDFGGLVLGVVRVREVQWYQWEIDHLSVRPDVRCHGIGTELVREAEERAKQQGALIAQCTIRDGNEASEALFRKRGYTATVTFMSPHTGNHVTAYQKTLT